MFTLFVFSRRVPYNQLVEGKGFMNRLSCISLGIILLAALLCGGCGLDFEESLRLQGQIKKGVTLLKAHYVNHRKKILSRMAGRDRYGPGEYRTLLQETYGIYMTQIKQQERIAVLRLLLRALPAIRPTLSALAGAGNEVQRHRVKEMSPYGELLVALRVGGTVDDVLATYRKDVIKKGRSLMRAKKGVARRLKKNLRVLKEMLDKLRLFKAQIRNHRRALEEYVPLFPHASPKGELIRELSLTVLKHDLQIDLLKFGVSGQNGPLWEMPFKLELSGSLKGLLSWLYSLDGRSLKARVTALTLESAGSGKHLAKLRMVTFYFKGKPLVLSSKEPTSSLNLLAERARELNQLLESLKRALKNRRQVERLVDFLMAQTPDRVWARKIVLAPPQLSFHGETRDEGLLMAFIRKLKDKDWLLDVELKEQKSGGRKKPIRFIIGALASKGRPEKLDWSFRHILNRDLFHQRASDFTASAATVQVVHHSPLRRYPINAYKLAGTFTSSLLNPRALIKDPDGKSHIVKIGAKLGPNGIVAEIGPDYVVVVRKVSRGGKEQWRRMRLSRP